jgi:hypothetical protein
VIFAAIAGALALLIMVYCAVTSIREFRSGRLAWAVFGGVLAVLAPVALALFAVMLAQFMNSGGL